MAYRENPAGAAAVVNRQYAATAGGSTFVLAGHVQFMNNARHYISVTAGVNATEQRGSPVNGVFLKNP